MSRKISGVIALVLTAALATATDGGVIIPLIVGGATYTLARGGRP